MIATFALLIAAPQDLPAHPPAHRAPPGYALVWSDEFDTPGLPDPTQWRYDTERNAAGWFNDELQYYADSRRENARVENGALVIEARREALDDRPDWGGQRYSSARLLGPDAGWRYGFFEIRARLPCGRGSWPAIWMLPAKMDVAWPLMGEIDIMEHVGFDPGVVHGTVHTGAYNHVAGTQKGAQARLPDACDAYHRYQLRWTPERIDVGVDDRVYFGFANDGRGDRATWPFDRAFRLLLNVAVGGGWGGQQGIDDDAFPQAMRVDYVRVYQRGVD